MITAAVFSVIIRVKKGDFMFQFFVDIIKLIVSPFTLLINSWTTIASLLGSVVNFLHTVTMVPDWFPSGIGAMLISVASMVVAGAVLGVLRDFL